MGSVFGGGAKKAAKKAARKAEEEAKAERRRVEEETARVRAEEAARQERIQQGTTAVNTAFSGFDDPYYAGLGEKFKATQTGDLATQFKNAQKQLIYALGGRGLLNSSVAAEKGAELVDQNKRALAGIEDESAAYANRAREGVEQQRRNLIAQSYATADPSSVATQAIETAKAAPVPTISPLAAAFDTGMSQLAENAPPAGLVDWTGIGGETAKKKPAQQIVA